MRMWGEGEGRGLDAECGPIFWKGGTSGCERSCGGRGCCERSCEGLGLRGARRKKCHGRSEESAPSMYGWGDDEAVASKDEDGKAVMSEPRGSKGGAKGGASGCVNVP